MMKNSVMYLRPSPNSWLGGISPVIGVNVIMIAMFILYKEKCWTPLWGLLPVNIFGTLLLLNQYKTFVLLEDALVVKSTYLGLIKQDRCFKLSDIKEIEIVQWNYGGRTAPHLFVKMVNGTSTKIIFFMSKQEKAFQALIDQLRLMGVSMTIIGGYWK